MPVLLVSLGFGAAVAGMIGAAPWLVVLSRHKGWLFSGTALLLIACGLLMFRAAPARPTPGWPVPAPQPRWKAFGRSVRAYLWLPLRQLIDQ